MRCQLLLNLGDLLLQLDMLPALLGYFGLQFLHLELNGIQLNEKLCVLLCPLLYVILGTSLILDSINLESGNGPFHVPELSVQLFKSLGVLLALAQILIGCLRHNIVLIQFHHSSHIGLLVLGLNDLVDILSEFHDSLFLLGSSLPLLLQVQMTLIDLRLFFGKFFAQLIHSLHLTFEDLLKVEELIFKILDSLLLGL